MGPPSVLDQIKRTQVEITIIPVKKIVENKKFLIIVSKAKLNLYAFVFF